MAKLEHIGIAVSDIDEALRVWREVLGVEPYKVEAIERDGIRTHFLSGGSAKIELLEATRPTSAIGGFLEKRGAGLHHLAFEVEDLASTLDRLRSHGYTPVDSEPRPGADGKMITFLHPRQTAGVLIELCETRESAFRLREVVAGGRSIKIREAGRPENPPCLVSGFGGRTELLGRRLERSFHVLTADDLDVKPADVLEAIGADRAHIAASRSFVKPAVEAATMGIALSLSILCDRAATAYSARPACPVLILALDAEDDVRTAVTMRSSLGGALAVLPEGNDDVLARLIERHIMRSS
ncbi:MAG: methylmalonyl-CoA epimerase [Rhodothermales bacterium]